MSANPVVAGPVDTATATSGTGLIDDIVTLSSAVHEGNWVDAALHGVAPVMDGIATALDPVGSLIAWGIGWVLDHVDPLKSWRRHHGIPRKEPPRQPGRPRRRRRAQRPRGTSSTGI